MFEPLPLGRSKHDEHTISYYIFPPTNARDLKSFETPEYETAYRMTACTGIAVPAKSSIMVVFHASVDWMVTCHVLGLKRGGEGIFFQPKNEDDVFFLRQPAPKKNEDDASIWTRLCVEEARPFHTFLTIGSVSPSTSICLPSSVKTSLLP